MLGSVEKATGNCSDDEIMLQESMVLLCDSNDVLYVPLRIK